MAILYSISHLPNKPAVYAMYGGRGRGLFVAYVGIADVLKRRIAQHLIDRNSSVTTGTAAVGLHPDHVTELRWWEHPGFDERSILEAAELVAFDLLEPALRSRGGITERAKQLYADAAFVESMQAMLAGEPVGRLIVPTLLDALERIAQLEQRLAALEQKLS
jgi:hypothetical protein